LAFAYDVGQNAIVEAPFVERELGELTDITPRLSDRQSLRFVEHGKTNAVPFATMPNQVVVTQISN
jgi:hypothetical protein